MDGLGSCIRPSAWVSGLACSIAYIFPTCVLLNKFWKKTFINFVVPVLNSNRQHLNAKTKHEKFYLPQGCVFEGVRDIKNKENRRSDMPDAHIYISSNPIPSPQSCQAQLAGGKREYLFFNRLSKYRKLGKGSGGSFLWLKYVLLFLTLPQHNSFPSVFCKPFSAWL